ncbi:ATP-binding protein [Ilumatobacter sp.]|uniref:ATP-binding protein n=1 Tax=Ilumatobacter sp. TaxID=1967498 RepID=UPI003C411273
MSSDVAEVSVRGGFRLEMPPALVSISISRSTVRRVVTFRDSDAESTFLVALTEIVANAVDEHARLGVDRPIVLEVRFGSDELVRVIDSGEGFSTALRSVPPIPIDGGEPDQRGRGLLLARALVPAIAFESSRTGTVVTLPFAGFGIVR